MQVTPLTPRVTNIGPHSEAREKASQDLVGGATDGSITTETLPNGVRMIIADRPGAPSVKVQVGIGAGSLQDFPGRLGMAHLLEHLAFEGSPTRPSSEQERVRASLGNNWNAFTNHSMVVYYGVAPAADAARAATLLTDMFRNPKLTGPRVAEERAAVNNEMTYWGGSLADVADDVFARQVFGTNAATNNVIGTRKTIAATSNADLREYHERYFVGRNTVALIEGDASKMPLATLRRELGKLEPGARVDNSAVDATLVPGQSLQLLDDPSSNTVAIQVSLPIATETLESVKTPAALLKTAISEQLFLKLRRIEHLTYGAKAKFEEGSAGHGLLTVTTNVPKANAKQATADIIATLTDAQDGFGPKTFATYKSGALATLRAADAAESPTISELADQTFEAALVEGGVEVATPSPDHTARQRAAIGRTDAKQLARDLGQLIDFSNIKVLATGAVGDGSAIRAGLREGGIDTRAMTMNPVDLSMYRDMGIKVPAQRG